MNRSESILQLTSLGLLSITGWSFMENQIAKRKIPSTLEELPCVIPGASKVSHLLDNLQSGRGKLPELSHRKRMIQLIE